jgi:hypothetical protein
MPDITPFGVLSCQHLLVSSACFTHSMSDDASIRRENLRRQKLTPKELEAKLGRSYSYWRDLLEDPKKSFGEKAARSIEEGLGLPRGSFDLPAGPPASQAVGHEWPLPNISRARLSVLTPNQRSLLEGYMLAFLLRLEAGGNDDAPLLIIPAPEGSPESKEGMKNGKVINIRKDEAAPRKSRVGKSSGKSFATSKKR